MSCISLFSFALEIVPMSCLKWNPDNRHVCKSYMNRRPCFWNGRTKTWKHLRCWSILDIKWGKKGSKCAFRAQWKTMFLWICDVCWMMHCCHFVLSILVDIVVVLQAVTVSYLPLQSDLMFLSIFSGYWHLTANYSKLPYLKKITIFNSRRIIWHCIISPLYHSFSKSNQIFHKDFSETFIWTASNC